MTGVAGKLVCRVVAFHQHFVQPTQAHHVLANGAVAHFGLLKQILLEGHNVEIARMAVAGNFTAEPAQCGQLILHVQPDVIVNRLIHTRDGVFIDDFATKHQRHAIQQLTALGAMSLAVFVIF
ncbi:hypothetical protein D3C80_1500780 [compost metagenome]